MKAIGIIAEYNPFHNGHLYHLNTIKKHYKDYKIVLILNGNFTERGDVSIIDKWKRTEIALKEGIDLVIELPFPFATQSADYFSYGAITLLEYLNVEKVVFGSESDNIEDLKLIAKTQLDNEEFDKLDQWLLQNGILQVNDENCMDCAEVAFIGPNDMKLMQALIKGGSEHRKFMR